MKPACFEYLRPRSLSEALELLTESAGDVQLLAGGQSLIPMMNLRVASPALIIDIARLPELLECSADGDTVSLGACVTHAAVEDGRVPDASLGLMRRAASGLAYRAVRSRGTIGGSLALADPAAEWPTVLAALDAKAVLSSPNAHRTVRIPDLITGTFETTIKPGELIGSIQIKRLSGDARWGYSKFSRKSGAFANSIAAVIRDPCDSFCRAVLGAANGAPIVLSQTSQVIADAGTQSDVLQQAISRDLAAAADRLFDNFELQIHSETITRAIRQVLE